MGANDGGDDAIDEIELEDKYHDPNTFVSVAAIEHEAKYIGLLMHKYRNIPDELSFFEFRKDALLFSKDTIEANI